MISQMEIAKMISETLDELLGKIYADLGIKSGDIFPLQSVKWDKLVNEMAELFADLIELNR